MSIVDLYFLYLYIWKLCTNKQHAGLTLEPCDVTSSWKFPQKKGHIQTCTVNPTAKLSNILLCGFVAPFHGQRCCDSTRNLMQCWAPASSPACCGPAEHHTRNTRSTNISILFTCSTTNRRARLTVWNTKQSETQNINHTWEGDAKTRAGIRRPQKKCRIEKTRRRTRGDAEDYSQKFVCTFKHDFKYFFRSFYLFPLSFSANQQPNLSIKKAFILDRKSVSERLEKISKRSRTAGSKNNFR